MSGEVQSLVDILNYTITGIMVIGIPALVGGATYSIIREGKDFHKEIEKIKKEYEALSEKETGSKQHTDLLIKIYKKIKSTSDNPFARKKDRETYAILRSALEEKLTPIVKREMMSSLIDRKIQSFNQLYPEKLSPTYSAMMSYDTPK